MDYQIVLSDFFISDLQEIVDYLTARTGAATAARIGNELLDRTLQTGRHPFAGQPIRQRPGARKVRRHSYLICYDVDEARRVVEVLRVWHGARDPKTLRFDRPVSGD